MLKFIGSNEEQRRERKKKKERKKEKGTKFIENKRRREDVKNEEASEILGKNFVIRSNGFSSQDRHRRISCFGFSIRFGWLNRFIFFSFSFSIFRTLQYGVENVKISGHKFSFVM